MSRVSPLAQSPVVAAGVLCWRLVRGQARVLVVRRTRYDDLSVPKGKLDPGEAAPEAAVRELMEETGVAAHLDWFDGLLGRQHDALVARKCPAVQKRVCHHILQDDWLHLDPDRSVFRASKKQHILDEAPHLVGLADDRLQRFAQSLRVAIAAPQGDFGLATQDGQRRAQFMAEIGEEAGATGIHIAQTCVRFFQFSGPRLQLYRPVRHLRLKIQIGALQRRALASDLSGHSVEAVGQIAQLVPAMCLDNARKITSPHGISRIG